MILIVSSTLQSSSKSQRVGARTMLSNSSTCPLFRSPQRPAPTTPQRLAPLIIRAIPKAKWQNWLVGQILRPRCLSSRVWLVHRRNLSRDSGPLELSLYRLGPLLLQMLIPFHELVYEAQMWLNYNIQTAGAYKTAAVACQCSCPGGGRVRGTY